MFAADGLVAQNVAFGIVALIMVVGAVRVVTTDNVVHAALWLVAVMAGAAAQYVILRAEFVAVTQILVYIGAVTVLFLFGVMLTRARIGRAPDLNNKTWALGIPVALVVLGTLTYVLVDTFQDDKVLENPDDLANPVTTAAVSDAIFKPYLIPFWALSFVLLVALVGAIVLARRD
jgi:NADH-quinone oxidoreductase subunit J